ncbi:hypothetical protein MKEN_00733800 [Mycena kentingensis (nom. inval.)]|nr:hypothetical protein MKEN_00733800 [Mycena kentingensis (nom. inval.)]
MFGGATTSEYDDIVAKATDENLTTENWELILNLCDKVTDEGPQGAHNVVAALLKRLTHRNPNVQLYALSLAEALSKNCSIELHREIASRAWTQGLERVITDRNTHEKVRTRALGLVAMWTEDFANDSTLGIMQECHDGLKAKNYKYTPPDEVPPPAVDDAIRRREEEELQRVLEMSMHDRGGRQPYSTYNGGGASSSSGAGGSSSTYNGVGSSSSSTAYGGASSTGYTPAAQQPQNRTPSPVPAATSPNPSQHSFESGIITRVRALHPFTPTESGELGFEKGDIIKVVDRGYRDWWRGQLKGRTGIFPVNYVEPLPEPTAEELAAEATQEASVFAQATNVERLLNMLRGLDPAKGDNLADDEEIQELYRSCMALRPKIVKLIDKYSQKRADLVSMNETFVRARTIFDRMMEESLARHTGGTPGVSGYYPQPQPQPGYSGAAQSYPFPADASQGAYYAAQQQQQQPAYSAQGPQPYPAQTQAQPPYGAQGPQPYPPQNQPVQNQQQPYGAQGPQPYPVQQQQQQQQGATNAYPYSSQGQSAPTPTATQAQPLPYPGQQQQQPASATPYGGAPQAQAQSPVSAFPAQAQPVSAQPQPEAQAQAQPVQATQPAQAQTQTQAQPEPQPAQTQTQTQTQPAQTQAQPAGPPYIFDTSATYADPNVQAWMQYYAAGGKDLAGSVYFVSVPGVTDGAAQAQAQPAQQAQPTQQQQAQPAQHQPAQSAQQAQPVQAQQSVQAQTVIPAQSAVPTSPIDDDSDYLPDPYANQPLPDPYAQSQAQSPPQATYTQPQSELSYALGQQASAVSGSASASSLKGYSLADPGSGSGSGSAQPARQGFSLTDPGFASASASGSAAAAGSSSVVAAGPSSPVASSSSPVAETSVPSWVLPKRTPGAGSPQPGGGLSSQFAGMHV